MNKTILGLVAGLVAMSSNVYASECEANVDKLQLFYINGMFTGIENAEKNVKALNAFQDQYLSDFEKNAPVEYAHNFSENFMTQIAEVAFHKMTEEEKAGDKGALLLNIIHGKPTYILDDAAYLFSWFFSEIVEDVSIISQEGDYLKADTKLKNVLDQCARTILVTHSQGNFYGNSLYTDIGNSYSYPNDALLSEYPMLGYIGIANPTYSVGGSFGLQNPNIAKTFTNNNDRVMAGVRAVFGAVPADPVSANLFKDFTGHLLESSYLANRGAPVIASRMLDIANNLTPYPLFDQYSVSSSAITDIGYSSMSEILDIRFKYGGGYRYSGVPEHIGKPFIDATSHGSYFNEFIREHYDYEKIEEEL